MTKVFVVFGECGEYSDWSMWAVRAFTNEAEAEKFSDMCQEDSEACSLERVRLRALVPKVNRTAPGFKSGEYFREPYTYITFDTDSQEWKDYQESVDSRFDPENRGGDTWYTVAEIPEGMPIIGGV